MELPQVSVAYPMYVRCYVCTCTCVKCTLYVYKYMYMYVHNVHDCPYLLQRPPVEWGDCPPKAATYVFPYVVAWMQESGMIKVYNLVHQRCVQEIPFPVMETSPTQTRSPLLFYSTVSSHHFQCTHIAFLCYYYCSFLLPPFYPPPLHLQNGRYMGDFSGKLYAALDKSVYLLSAVPLKEQVREGNSSTCIATAMHITYRTDLLVIKLFRLH